MDRRRDRVRGAVRQIVGGGPARQGRGQVERELHLPGGEAPAGHPEGFAEADFIEPVGEILALPLVAFEETGDEELLRQGCEPHATRLTVSDDGGPVVGVHLVDSTGGADAHQSCVADHE